MTAPTPPLPMVEDELAMALQEAMTGGAMTDSQANAEMESNPPEDDGEDDKQRRMGLQRALFGSSFPLANESAEGLTPEQTDVLWADWLRELWTSRRESVEMHLHMVARNRLFRAGHQWIQSKGNGPWANPPRPKDAVRCVYNMMDKALDQRLQILTDQRPGFTVTPMTSDPEDRRKAQARQLAAEFQYDQMRMESMAREAAYWAQTDGASFWHMYWDSDRGPWDEAMGRAGSAPLGDLNVQVVRCEQIRVSPEASSTQPPKWVLLREVISKHEAANRYGVTGVQAADSDQQGAVNSQMTGGNTDSVASWVMSQTTVGEGERLRNEDTVERFTAYLAPQPDVLPKGLQIVVVGDRVVFGPSDLLWGVIPVVRVTDGSSDPSYFPRPTAEQWIDHQIRINTLLSKWNENIRVNAGGRFFGRPNAVTTETFLGGVTSYVEVRGGGPMNENVMPMAGFSVGGDVEKAFEIEKQAFEDASGYNAVSRGQVSGESGRAIIAAREQLERVFAPSVQAMATAFTDWCKVVLAGMAWGYDVPRSLGAVGKGRPDLAREITGQDLDGTTDVKVEKSTLMPMPFSYRMYLLDNWLTNGVIDMKEYRRRQLFAVARDISTPDEDQEARAKRVADAFRMGEAPPPMRWQDDESIHQDVLEREILLQDDLDEQVIALANQRWIELANQAAMKMGGLPPGMPQGAPADEPRAPGAASVPGLPPNQLPLASGNPPFGAAPAVRSTVMGMREDEQNAQIEDQLTPQ